MNGMRIGLYLYGINTLDVRVNRLSNMQGDEIIARAWAKHLCLLGHSVTLFAPPYRPNPDAYDVIIYFNPMLQRLDHHGKTVLYVQNATSDESEMLKQFESVRHEFNAYMFTSETLMTRCKSNGLVVPFACDADELPKIEKKYTHSASFLGNPLPRSPDWLERYISPMSDFGGVLYSKHPWPQQYASMWRGGLPIEDTGALYRSSSINVNVHILGHVVNETVNFRIFDVLGNGGFIISDTFKKLEIIFGDSIAYTTGFCDMKEKLSMYIADEQTRKKMSDEGMRIVRSAHTFKHRAESIDNFLRNSI